MFLQIARCRVRLLLVVGNQQAHDDVGIDADHGSARLAARRRMTDCISSTVARRLGRGRMSRSVETSRVAAASRTEPSGSTMKRSRSPTFKCIRIRIAFGIVTCPLLEIVDSLILTYLWHDSLLEVKNHINRDRFTQQTAAIQPMRDP